MEDNRGSSYFSAKTLVERANELDQAQITVQSAERPQVVYRVTLDLSKERSQFDPKSIFKAFKSVFVEHATDPRAQVFMRPITKSEEQDFFALGYKDSWGVSSVINEAHFHWPAQNGSVTLVFFSNSDFRSGSQISFTSGGVSISEGSSIYGPTQVTIPATTPTIIAPQNFTRKVSTIQNKTGADLYIGGASIGAVGSANEGIKIVADGIVIWKNTGALYAWSSGGGTISRLDEE